MGRETEVGQKDLLEWVTKKVHGKKMVFENKENQVSHLTTSLCVGHGLKKVGKL